MIITELPISDIKKNEDNNPLDIIKNTIKSRITLYEKTDNGDYFGYDETIDGYSYEHKNIGEIYCTGRNGVEWFSDKGKDGVEVLVIRGRELIINSYRILVLSHPSRS